MLSNSIWIWEKFSFCWLLLNTAINFWILLLQINTTTITSGTFVSLQQRNYTKNQVKKIRFILENSKSEYLMKIHRRATEKQQVNKNTDEEKVTWKPGESFHSYRHKHCHRYKVFPFYFRRIKIISIPCALQQVPPVFHKLLSSPYMERCPWTREYASLLLFCFSAFRSLLYWECIKD